VKLVVIESPYAGNMKANVEYARACVRDSLGRGEAPFASHLLYTQPGILNDDDKEERRWGMKVGHAWIPMADILAIYTDRGISKGMKRGRGYAEYTKHSESPDLFHFWTGVFTIAGALRRQVWIDQRYFHWTPNFYIVLVGPAGVAAKSTSLRLGTNLLRFVDGIKFGPKSMTWQALTHALEEAFGLVPFPNGDLYPMSCITCSITELGTFLRPEDKVMMDVLVDLWDGQLEPWDRRTVYKEGQVLIENPWINIMGCTTPAWLRDNMPEAMIGGGLIRRIVFVYGEGISLRGGGDNVLRFG